MKTLKIVLMMCLCLLAIDTNAATVIMKLTDDSGYVGKLKMTIGATAHSDKKVTVIYDEHFQYQEVVTQEDAPARFDFVLIDLRDLARIALILHYICIATILRRSGKHPITKAMYGRSLKITVIFLHR